MRTSTAESTSPRIAAAEIASGQSDSLDDLGIELDLDSLDGDEDLEDAVTTDEEQ